MNNSTRTTSVIAMENTDNKCISYCSHREAVSCYHKSTPCVVSEKNWNTKKDKSTVSPLCMYCTYFSCQKGMSSDKVMSISKIIKLG